MLCCVLQQRRTALHVASNKGHTEIVDKLLTVNLEGVNAVDKVR